MTAFVLKTAKQIGTMVDTAIKHTVTGDQLIHDAAVQTMAHAERHGDCTLADRLVKGLGRSIRVQGLRVWYAENSPIRWNGDNKVGMLKTTDRTYKPFNIDQANAVPFYALGAAEERTAKPLDTMAILKLIHGLKGRVEKAVTDGRFEGDSAKALGLVEAVGAYADGLVAKDPAIIRDGNFDPKDPENAKTPEAIAPPATTPRRARRTAAPKAAEGAQAAA